MKTLNYKVLFLAVAALIVIAAAQLRADTISLTDMADGRVIQNVRRTPTTGPGRRMSAYSTSNTASDQHALLRFDRQCDSRGGDYHLGNADAHQTPGSTNFVAILPVSIWRVTTPWTESQVTWNKYDGTNAWTTAGGDFVGNPTAAYASYNSGAFQPRGLPVQCGRHHVSEPVVYDPGHVSQLRHGPDRAARPLASSWETNVATKKTPPQHTGPRWW